MGTNEPVVSLGARRASDDAALSKRLLDAYETAKANDDGRRVERSDLIFTDRERI